MRAIALILAAILAVQFTDAQNAQICGGTVSGVSFSISAADRIPLATGKSVTVAFTTQTPLASGNLVSIVWPAGYLSGTLGVTYAGAANTFATTTTAITNGVTIAVGAAAAAAAAYTVTLTGATIGAPQAATTCGVTVSTTADLPATAATAALGGAVSGVAFTIAAADRVPAGATKSVTVAFTTQTLLANTQLVSIVWPAGYLSGTITVTYAGTANTFATVTSAITNGVTIAVGSNTAIAAAYTVTLTGATIGGPIAASASTGITVTTSTDMAGTGGYPALGGSVSGITFSIATADRVPAGATKSVTVAFTTQTALASGQLVTISWPSSYLTGTIGVTFATGNTFATSTTAVGTTGVTIAVGSVGAAAAAYTVTLTGATIGAAQAATSCGVTVSTTNDLAATGATVALGGSVSGVTFTIATADRLPAATGKSVTVGFTTQTALASGQLVTISWPSSYLTGTIGVTFATGNTFATSTTAVGTTGVTIAVGPAGAANAAYTVTLTGATLTGIIAASASTGITVSTSTDMAGTGGYPALGGQVTGVSMTIASADRIPLATGKSVTVAFTTQTSLANSQLVTISWPSGYLTGTIGVTFATGNTFATTTTAVGTTGVTIAVGSVGAAAASYTVTLTGATMPSIMSAGCNIGIWVSTTTDLRSVNSVTTQAFGGVVSSVSSTIAAADRVPGLTNKSITVSFTTQTLLASGQLVSIVFRTGYFSGTIGVSYAGAANTFASTTSAITNGVTIAVGSATAAPGSYTVTLINATIGGPMAASASGVTVSTTTDMAATGAAVALGGQVSSVSINIATADRVPYAAGKTVTVSFTTQTALASGQTVSITFPSSFLTGTIAVTYAGTANTFATTTTAVGTSALTIAVGSAGAAAAAYTITLTGATMPAPQAAGTGGSACASFNFGVQTTADMIGGANTPQIGGVVSGVTFTVAAADRIPTATGKSVTVSFTTQTALASGNLVTIRFPATYIAGSIGVTFAGAANYFATTATTVSNSSLTIAVGSAGAAPAAYTITLTGATMGSPMAGNMANGVTVSTTADLGGSTGFPALGGTVSGATLTIATADRIVSAANRKITVSFTTASALVTGNIVTVVLPSGLVTAVTGGAATGISATAALSGANNIALTATANVGAGLVTVVICGVTLGSLMFNAGMGVMTTMDYITTCSVTANATIGTQGRVTAVSMSIPFANRVAGNTAQSATFAFTTATMLPASSTNCNAVNSVTIAFPANFFVSNAAGSCGASAAMLTVTGLTGYTLTGTGSGPSSTTTFVFTGTAALPAANYRVVIGGLTLGAATAGGDANSGTGITVRTSMDTASVIAPSGPISGYQVTSVTMPSCQASPSCQSIVIGFNSTVGSIPPGGTLAIGFTTAPVAGAPDAFMSGSALITGEWIIYSPIILHVAHSSQVPLRETLSRSR